LFVTAKWHRIYILGNMTNNIRYDGVLYQTHDVGEGTQEFEIRHGRLLELKGHFVETPREEKPCPDALPGSFPFMMGCMKWVRDCVVDTHHHGFIGATGPYGEVIFKFTDGLLVEVTPQPVVLTLT
jgi:hypothetical protein